MKKQILLINPANVAYTLANGTSIPLGIAYLAAQLQKNGHTVRCVDLQVENETVLDAEFGKADIVGISALTPNISEAWRLAKKAKEKNKMVILGGPHPTVLPEETLKTGFVDIVCRKESENTLVELAGGEVPLEDVKGISYLKDGAIVHNPDREYIKNLDDLAMPARRLFPIDKYRLYLHKGKRVMTISTSRGCPNNCNFCYKGICGRTYRMRGVDNMIAEWEDIIRLGGDEVVVVDDCFTVNKKRVMDFCGALIRGKYKMHWEGSGRIDTVDKEVLTKMKEAGYWRIAMGIESGSQKILDQVGKGITKEKIRASVKCAKEAGLKVVGYFMIGNYGEDAQTIEETIQFAKELPLDYIQFTVAVPYPGTQLYDMIKANGKFLFSQWSELGSYSGKAYFEEGNITKELVERSFKKAYRSIYLSPRMIIKNILQFHPDMVRFLGFLK